MNRLIRLKDSEWNRLEPLLRRPPGPGRPSRPDREMLEAMLWILRTGAPWRDLPIEYGAWQSVYTRFSRWSAQGVLQRIFDELTVGRDGEGYIIDATIVRAHQDASGAQKKPANKRLGIRAAVRRRKSTS
jgi:transposase